MTRGPERWLPALAALVALLPNLRAAWPDRSYFLRDFTLTYYPLRDVIVAALRDGHWPFWNPYLHEGCAFLPMLYPLELVQVLWPGPVFASWLLTLHFPLAALGGYCLGRELGANPPGAFATGSIWSLCGLATTSLDLHWFLQAYALAPFVVLSLRRAARLGGRWVAAAALVVAVAISTLAVEFVGQAAVVGAALAAGATPQVGLGTRLRRLAGAALLGLAVAALPIALVAGLLRGSVRGAGLPSALLLDRSLHPVSLLQLVIPDLHGSIREPLRHWWAGRLLPGGSPYFLSLYLGPVALALAAAGTAVCDRLVRRVLIALGVAGVLYALGPWGGLAPLAAEALPLLRFPVKAMLMPTLTVAVLAGFGVDRLGAPSASRSLLRAAGAIAAVVTGVMVCVGFAGSGLARWLDISPTAEAVMRGTLLRESAECLGLVAVLAGVVWLTARDALAGRRAPALLALACLDLWRAAAGVNQQVDAGFFAPLPGLREALAGLDGGRVFSLALEHSPAVGALLDRREPRLEARSFFLARQTLTPYASLLDRVELAEGADRLSFIPNPPLIEAWEQSPEALSGVLPRLRNAGVARIVSLDALDHPELRLRTALETGVAGVQVRVYDLAQPWPRAFVACRAIAAADRRSATLVPFSSGYDPGRDVGLEGAPAAGCARASVVSRRELGLHAQEIETEADGTGYLVLRDSFAAGWRARLDDRPTPILRANGRHRAVAVPPGRHRVRLDYHPPGLSVGAALSGLGLLAAGGAFFRGRA